MGIYNGKSKVSHNCKDPHRLDAKIIDFIHGNYVTIIKSFPWLRTLFKPTWSALFFSYMFWFPFTLLAIICNKVIVYSFLSKVSLT